jgi:putative tricarboxylic transport membrane protein
LHRIDRYTGLAACLLGGGVFATARRFPNVPGQDLGASTMPTLIGAGLLACGVLLVIRSLRARVPAAGGVPEAATPERIFPPLAMLGAILFYVLASEWLGYPIVAPLTLLVGLLALRVGVGRAIAFALGASLLVHLLFYKMLRVPLPWGIVPPLY